MTRFPFLHTTGFAARGLTLLLMIVVTISASFAAERLPADESHGASAPASPVSRSGAQSGKTRQQEDRATNPNAAGDDDNHPRKAPSQKAARNRVLDKQQADDQDDEPEKKPVDQGALLQTQSATGQVRVKSWKTLRDDGIVKQDLDYSCGAASAATLLNSFYGQKISEKRFLKAMGEEDGMASFDDMAKAMPKFGFKARGFAASWDQLVKLKMPVIVYVKYRKDDHFSVLRGISGNTVWLADPSLGNRTFSKAQFLQMWQTRKDDKRPALAGKFLAVLPARVDIGQTDVYFSKAPRRQSGVAVEQLSVRTGE